MADGDAAAHSFAQFLDGARVKAVAIVLIVVVASAACAWNLAASLCNHLLIDTRPFDFVCGHNAPLQLIPSFLLFLAVFSRLIPYIWRRASEARSRSSGSDI